MRGSGGAPQWRIHPPCFGRWWPWPPRRCRQLWHCGYPVCCAPCLLPGQGWGPPSLAWGPWGCPAQPSFVLPRDPWVGRAGSQRAPASPVPCWGCADTQGASHGVILPLRALAKIPMEPLGIPGHGLALLRGNSLAITRRHRERPRPSWCHSAALGGAFCGYSSAHQKTPLSPKIGCSHPLLVKNLGSG